MEAGTYIGTYLGKDICGFKSEHEYQFKVKHNGQVYELFAFYDFSIDENVDLFLTYASEISIKSVWVIKGEV